MKKALTLLLVVVLTASIAIGGTLAYLTDDADPKTNVFSVGDIDISIDEEVGVIGDGGDVDERDDGTGADYTTIMPGDYLQKEVTVTNSNKSNDAYVAVTVTLNNAGKINLALDEHYEGLGYTADEVQAIYDQVFDGWGINYNPRPGAAGVNDARGVIDDLTGLDSHILKVDFAKTTDYDNDTFMFGINNWFKSDKEKAVAATGKYSTHPAKDGYYTANLTDDPSTSEDERDYIITYTYYLYLPTGESATLFKGLNIPAEFDADQLAMFDGLEINVNASAIQADNIPGGKGTEIEAKNAFSLLATGSPYMPTTNWSTYADTTWYDNGETSIDTAEELAGLAKLVNEGNTFKGETITLAADIDLSDHQWTPIGKSGSAFQGNFDGGNKTISNLLIDTPSTSYVGLFGYTTNGSVKNVTVNNASVKGRLGVGAVAGSPYTSTYDNITVTGYVAIDGMSYVGGVLGRNAYANVSNVTVNVDAGSYVNVNSIENGTAYRTYVGGVIGFMGEGKHTVSNVTSNIDVIGTTCDIGGIVGIAHYGNSFVNCSSSGNVTVTNAESVADAEEVGGIAGVWHNGGADVTFTNCSYTGKLSANISGVDYSDNTITGAAYSTSGSGNLIIN